jgi:hypothetical protein
MSGIPRIQTGYSDTYKRINVAGIFGGILPGGLEAIVYSEERRADAVLETAPISPEKIIVKRTVEAELIVDPMEMKSIHAWLGDKIAEYERLFGKIPSPDEVQNRAKKGADL